MKTSILTLFIFLLSINANAQWVQIPNGIGSDSYIYSLAATGNNIYAGTAHGIFISSNNGSSWNQSGMDTLYVLSLAALGNNIYAGSDMYGVYSSTNNGINWTQTALNNFTIWSFAISGNSIYAGTQGGGVYLSNNNGSNWAFIGLSGTTIHSLVISGSNLIAATGNGVFLTSNNGANWYQKFTAQSINTLAANENNVFAGSDSLGVYISSNNGANWSQTAFNNKVVNSLAIIGGNIFAGTGKYPSGSGSIFLSTDNGTSWSEKNQGLNAIPIVISLVIAADYVYAGTYGLSVWRRALNEMIGIKQISEIVPLSYSLYQNYPNPFNPVTKIKFDVPVKSDVKIEVTDIIGRTVSVLLNGNLNAGAYETSWDAGSNASGIYFVRLISGNFRDTKKIVLIK